MASESLEKLKENDPKKYERVMYARKTIGLLLLPTAPIVFWLNLQPCTFFSVNCNIQEFVSTYLISLFFATCFLKWAILDPLMLKKFGKAEMARQAEEEKTAVEKFKKERASEESKKAIAQKIYLYQLGTLVWFLAGVVLFALFFFIDRNILTREFDFPAAKMTFVISAILGFIVSRIVVYKKSKTEIKE